MKQKMISSGRRDVSHRIQFEASSEVRMCDDWLEQELMDRLSECTELVAQTIEVAKATGRPDRATYRVTFAPEVRGHSHRLETLGIDDILTVLEGIETEVRSAVKTKHLLSGLEV